MWRMNRADPVTDAHMHALPAAGPGSCYWSQVTAVLARFRVVFAFHASAGVVCRRRACTGAARLPLQVTLYVDVNPPLAAPNVSRRVRTRVIACMYLRMLIGTIPPSPLKWQIILFCVNATQHWQIGLHVLPL